MTRVKICGITRLDDALLAADCGADALGFNFYVGSKRCVSPAVAAAMTAQLPERIVKVGVFVNESVETILRTVMLAGLGAIQLHGDESPQFVADLKDRTDVEVIKAMRVTARFDPNEARKFKADAILLDGYSAAERGGTGVSIDLCVAKTVSTLTNKLYLAGGLSPENVGNAIRTVRPFAVDACSKLESEPGKKDAAKVRQFLREAKAAI